jgi:hypothetical protein
MSIWCLDGDVHILEPASRWIPTLFSLDLLLGMPSCIVYFPYRLTSDPLLVPWGCWPTSKVQLPLQSGLFRGRRCEGCQRTAPLSFKIEEIRYPLPVPAHWALTIYAGGLRWTLALVQVGPCTHLLWPRLRSSQMRSDEEFSWGQTWVGNEGGSNWSVGKASFKGKHVPRTTLPPSFSYIYWPGVIYEWMVLYTGSSR